MFIVNWKISLSFTKPYTLSFDMHYPDPITIQRQSPYCMCPMTWDIAYES